MDDKKNEFIRNYQCQKVVCTTSLKALFKKIEQYEIELNKDVTEFTKEEILDMYTSFHSKSEMTLLNNNTILKAYHNWNSSKTQNRFNEISVEEIRNCVDKSLRGYLTLNEIIEVEESLLNYTDAAIVHAIFIGISGPSMKDLTSLNADMLDSKNNCIIFNDGRNISIDERLTFLLLKAFDETLYTTYGSTMVQKELFGRGKLFKQRDNATGLLDTDDKSFRACYRKIQIFSDYLNIKGFTMKSIAASGFLHYLRMGISNSGKGLKEYLMSKEGNEIMDRYGYDSEYRVDNVIYKYKKYI